MNIIVSIIIPHYNNSKILIECINSLTKSTFKNIEIIVVDNASTDFSYGEIIKTFSDVISRHDPELRPKSAVVRVVEFG